MEAGLMTTITRRLMTTVTRRSSDSTFDKRWVVRGTNVRPDENGRRLLRCVISDASTWFDRLTNNCPACCSAIRDKVAASCREHVPDHWRAADTWADLSLWLDYEDTPGRIPQELTAGQLRVIAEALPLALDIRRARQNDCGSIEDHALVAAYSELVQQLAGSAAAGRRTL
jgi:hypothetical protein